MATLKDLTKVFFNLAISGVALSILDKIFNKKMGYIERLEISKTDKAKCSLCNRKILINELRGVAINQRFNSAYYYCYDCSLKMLEDYQEQIKTLLDIHKGYLKTNECKEFKLNQLVEKV